jgi:hypothetical protein
MIFLSIYDNAYESFTANKPSSVEQLNMNSEIPTLYGTSQLTAVLIKTCN